MKHWGILIVLIISLNFVAGANYISGYAENALDGESSNNKIIDIKKDHQIDGLFLFLNFFWILTGNRWFLFLLYMINHITRDSEFRTSPHKHVSH